MSASIVHSRRLGPSVGRSRPSNPLVALVVTLPLILGLAACQGVDEQQPEEVGTTAEGAPAADDYFADDGVGADVALGSSAVEVRLHGRTIEMPGSLPPGETTFLVSNTGDHEHSFEIEGNGIEEVLAANLLPGESGELTVHLDPGTYTVYCPVGEHREEGMVTTLRIVG